MLTLPNDEFFPKVRDIFLFLTQLKPNLSYKSGSGTEAWIGKIERTIRVDFDYTIAEGIGKRRFLVRPEYQEELKAITGELKAYAEQGTLLCQTPFSFRERYHRSLGKILGYPETAIEAFVKDDYLQEEQALLSLEEVADLATWNPELKALGFKSIRLSKKNFMLEIEQYYKPKAKYLQLHFPDVYKQLLEIGAEKFGIK